MHCVLEKGVWVGLVLKIRQEKKEEKVTSEEITEKSIFQGFWF